MDDIQGKVAVVTGGASGIGLGLAKALAREGASVCIADIRMEAAQSACDEIASTGGKVFPVQCDVSDRDSVRQLREAAVRALGPVSLLFANAGATSFDPLIDMPENDVDWIIQVNLMGATNCVMAFLPDMIERQHGHICATASMAGLMPGWVANHAPYSAAKMGIIGLMLNLRMELEQHNIGTTVYCPGGVATGMKANNSLYRPERFGGPREGEVDLHGFENPFQFLSPDVAAGLVLRAVKANRPIVLDHADQKELFHATYVDLVNQAFADVEAHVPETTA